MCSFDNDLNWDGVLNFPPRVVVHKNRPWRSPSSNGHTDGLCSGSALHAAGWLGQVIVNRQSHTGVANTGHFNPVGGTRTPNIKTIEEWTSVVCTFHMMMMRAR